jgi:ribosomal protein S18 acetylase RimI-like enzyme
MAVGDIESALALWRRTEGMGLSDVDTPDRIAAYLARNPGLSVVAELDGAVVGAALCGHDGRRGYLHHVAVDKDCRRRGLGRTLVQSCLDALGREGITRCHLFVYASNAAGIAFWEHAGWRQRDDLAIFSRDIGKGPAAS